MIESQSFIDASTREIQEALGVEITEALEILILASNKTANPGQVQDEVKALVKKCLEDLTQQWQCSSRANEAEELDQVVDSVTSMAFFKLHRLKIRALLCYCRENQRLPESINEAIEFRNLIIREGRKRISTNIALTIPAILVIVYLYLGVNPPVDHPDPVPIHLLKGLTSITCGIISVILGLDTHIHGLLVKKST